MSASLPTYVPAYLVPSILVLAGPTLNSQALVNSKGISAGALEAALRRGSNCLLPLHSRLMQKMV